MTERCVPLRPPELQPQLVNQGFHIIGQLWIQEPGSTEKGARMTTERFFATLRMTADEPIGDIDVSCEVFRGGDLLQEWRDGDVVTRELAQLLTPLLEAVHVGPGDDLTAFENVQAIVEPGFAAGGQPDVLRHQACCNHRRLLTLHQTHRLPRIQGQQVLPKQTLTQLPIGRKLAGLLHHGMHPGDAARDVRVLDTMTCLGVVHHDLAGAAAALDVYLEEDGGPGLGDADAVVADEALKDNGIQEGAEESNEVRIIIKTDAAADDVIRNEAEILGFRLRMTRDGRIAPVGAGFLVRMVGKELLGGVMISAAGGVVADAYRGVQLYAVLVHVAREASRPPTAGAGVPGGRAAIFLKGVHG